MGDSLSPVRKARVAAAWTFLALSLLSGLLSAQQVSKRPLAGDAVVREALEVREVHLDAVVTDRENAPVGGLSVSDFTLRVEGEKVRITGVSSGAELRGSLAGRLTVVVLLDERHLREVHRDEVLVEVEAALVAEMRRHPTWVAIAALSNELVPILAPTRDVVAVQDAFVQARSRVLGDTGLIEQQRMTSNELRDLLRSLAERGSAYRMGQINKNGVLNRLQTYGVDVARDTRETLAHVGALVDALAFVPGRKAVLMISDGLAEHPLDSVSETLYDRIAGGSRQYSGDDMMASSSRLGINDRNNRPSGSDRSDQGARPQAQQDDGGVLDFQRAVAELDCGDLFDRVAALANTHRATFYPLKPPVRDSSMSGLGERSGEKNSITRLSDRWAGLEGLALATGGIAFDGENGVPRFLRQTREDLAAYYALSFLPPEGMNDSGIREVALRVRGRQNRLRFRASFIPLALEQRLSSQAWGTLLFGWQDNPHELLLETQSGELQGGVSWSRFALQPADWQA